MQGLTPPQIAAWLTSHGQIEDPHLGDHAPPYLVTCYAPNTYMAMECFLRCVLRQLMAGCDCVFQVTDPYPSEECRDFAFYALRCEAGEKRSLEEAPGFFIPPAERERAIALFAGTAMFKWKAYLYADRQQMTLYNWEGDIFDFWSDSADKCDEFRRLMKGFELKEVDADHEAGEVG